MKKKILALLGVVLVWLCFSAAAHASVTDGRIVANIDLIETYGTTLHVSGWVYDKNYTGSTIKIHVDYQKEYLANRAKASHNSQCPVSGNHYFDFEYSWKNSGERVMINALYAAGDGNCSIYDNISVFPYVYTVTYNANGGTGAPATDYKHHDIALRLSGTKPTRTGYTFQGWAKSASGSAAYQANGSYTSNSNTTLYAVWKQNTYTVTYNANGGTGAPAAQTATHNANITLSSTVPTYAGHDFLGWATTQNGSAAYQPGANLNVQQNWTLYAVWKLKTYNVTYHANGGENAPQAQVKTYGQDLMLTTETPERTDYLFLGWAEQENAAQPTWQPGAIYTANAPLDLYAVWLEDRLPGDVNGDKAVDGKDALRLLRYVAEIPVEIVERNADVNADGIVNGKDSLRLLRYLAEQDVVLE